MKVTRWIDDSGYQRMSIIRDDDNKVMHAAYGLRRGPPDVTTLDWEEIVRDLHNALTDRNLFTYKDMVQSKDGVSSAILSALKRKVVTLYKQQR